MTVLLKRLVYACNGDKNMPKHHSTYGDNVVDELDEHCQRLNLNPSDDEFNECVKDIEGCTGEDFIYWWVE